MLLPQSQESVYFSAAFDGERVAVPAVRLARRAAGPPALLPARRKRRETLVQKRRERLLLSVELLAACSTGTLGVSRFEKAVTFPEKSDF